MPAAGIPRPFFTDKLADHIFAFEGDGVIKDFPGNYTQYKNWKEEEEEKKKKERATSKPLSSETKKKQSFPPGSGKNTPEL